MWVATSPLLFHEPSGPVLFVPVTSTPSPSGLGVSDTCECPSRAIRQLQPLFSVSLTASLSRQPLHCRPSSASSQASSGQYEMSPLLPAPPSRVVTVAGAWVRSVSPCFCSALQPCLHLVSIFLPHCLHPGFCRDVPSLIPSQNVGRIHRNL